MKFQNSTTTIGERTTRTMVPLIPALILALILIAGVVGLPACADHVPVPADTINVCPCSAGNVCCESGVCAKDQSSCGAATLALSEAAQGVWSGYLENFQFSTDDAIEISISVAADGTLAGQVVVGKDMPPAPATDPNAPWPPSVESMTPTLPSYIPGFVYDAQNIRWESQRLRFNIARYEPWQPWCQLQQSYRTDANSFNCIPGTGGVQNSQGCFVEDNAGHVIAPVECFKLTTFCGGSGPCSCDATRCGAQTDFSYAFDIALRNGVGDGSTDLSGGNIRLTQTSH